MAGVLSRLAGLSVLATDVTFTHGINELMGPNASKVIAVIAIVSSVSGEVLHLLSAQSGDIPGLNQTNITHTD